MTDAMPEVFSVTTSSLARLARDIAMDLHGIETILKEHKIDQEVFEVVSKSKLFQRILEDQVSQWEGAGNTHERVKIKSAMLVEEFLPSLFTRITSPKEPLNHVVAGGQLAAKLAGMAQEVGVGGESGRVNVTINMGAASLKFEKDAMPVISEGNLIEGEVL